MKDLRPSSPPRSYAKPRDVMWSGRTILSKPRLKRENATFTYAESGAMTSSKRIP
jgi:hypothetical protein